MTVLPSKFQIGNFLLATLTFFLMGTPFYLLNSSSLLNHVWGMFSFLSGYLLHRHRANNHKPPRTLNDLFHENESLMDKINSNQEEIILQLQIQNARR